MGFFQDDPFPVDPGQAAWAEARDRYASAQQAADDAAELERIALEQIALDVTAWDYVVDLDGFVRGERLGHGEF